MILPSTKSVLNTVCILLQRVCSPISSLIRIFPKKKGLNHEFSNCSAGECGIYKAFTNQGKAVFGIEYNGKSHCDEAEKQGISRKYKTSGGHWGDCDWMYKARAARMKKQEEDAAAAAAESSSSNVGYVLKGISSKSYSCFV